MIYLDTSVLVALYCPEALSAKADRIVRSQGPVAISDLTDVEVFSAVSRKVREKKISRQDARRVLDLFLDHVDAGIYDRIGLGAAHFQMARDWIARLTHPLRTLDALHLALAASAGRRLITADRRLSRSARSLRVPCRLLR